MVELLKVFGTIFAGVVFLFGTIPVMHICLQYSLTLAFFVMCFYLSVIFTCLYLYAKDAR